MTHKPLFCLILADDENEAYHNAYDSLTLRLNNSSIDWFQGIKESERYDENLEKYDKASKFDNDIKEIIEKWLEESEEISLRWIDNGIKQLEKYRQGQINDLQIVLDSFSIGSGDINAYVLDLTNYSDDFVISKSMFSKILEWLKEENKIQKLYVVGFDTHY